MSAAPDRAPGHRVVIVDEATAAGLASLGPDSVGWRTKRVPENRMTRLIEAATGAAADGASSIVVWCGGLDVRSGRPIADVVHHVAETLDAIRTDWADVTATVAAVPPGRGRWAGAVITYNGEIRRVTDQRAATWLDPNRGHTDIGGRSLAWWTDRQGRIRS